MAYLEVHGLAVTYATGAGAKVKAVDDLGLTIESQEFVSIIGPSGCGKSTLLHCMGGLLPPSAGRVVVDGDVMGKPDPSKASFVFQEYSLLPWKNVIDNTAIGLQFAKVPAAARRERAEQALALMGLTDFVGAYPHELSGGMQQRVAVARAMTMDPSILLMDEPFGALDEQTRRSLGLEMSSLLSQGGKTVVMVTHSLDEAIFWGDRVLVMSGRPGHVVKEFKIEAARPRTADFFSANEFVHLRAELLRLLDPTDAEPGSSAGSELAASKDEVLGRTSKAQL